VVLVLALEVMGANGFWSLALVAVLGFVPLVQTLPFAGFSAGASWFVELLTSLSLE